MVAQTTKKRSLYPLILSSTIFLGHLNVAQAVVQNLAGGGDVNNGEVVRYTGPAGQVIRLKAGEAFGLPDAADIAGGYPVANSLITTHPGQGIAKLEGGLIGAVIAPGALGQATSPLEQIVFHTTAANKGGGILGEVFANNIEFSGVNQGIFDIYSNATVTGNIDFKVGVDHSLIFDSTNGDLIITANDIQNKANPGFGSLFFTGTNVITLNSTVGVGGAINSVDVLEGVANVSQDIAVGDLIIDGFAPSVLTINAPITITGNLTARRLFSSALNIGSNLVTVTNKLELPGALVVQTSNAISTALGSPGKGHLEVGGGASNDPRLTLSVTPIGYIGTGNIALVHSAAGGGVLSDIPVEQINGQSAVLKFTAVNRAGANTHLDLITIRTPYISEVHRLNDQTIGLGGALEIEGAAGRLAALNPDFENFIGYVDRLPSSTAVSAALSTAAPTMNGAISQVAQTIDGRVIKNIAKRIAQVASNKQGVYNTGMSVGDITAAWGVWGDLFGSDFRQSKRNNIEGYDGNLWGMTFGADRLFNHDAIRVGIAGTYARTSIDHDLANNTTDIDSFQGILYGAWTDEPWRIQGMLGASYHDYEQLRNVIVGNTRFGTALGDYSSWEWLANAEVGYFQKNGAWTVIPSVSLRYSHLDIEHYMETGAGGFNLSVQNENLNALFAGFGVKLEYDYVYKGDRIVPEAHVNAFYDFIGERQEANSSLFGTGAAFNSKSFYPANDSYEIGAGVNFYTGPNALLSINYDYHFKKDFHANTGFLKIRYEW
ncbi:MAG: autotransporter outer membrane beta-barrel domain-containing protein [Gammaproteobacteria bacterium]